MAIREIITANCENGQLSKSKIARQWDDQGTLIQFAGYPEPETDEELTFRLIVWMKASEDADPSELPPIELEADQWLVSNVYTQLAQTIRFQLCITNEAGTYEKHSPIFAGNIGKSLSHNGEESDIDVSELFDPYKKYVDELIVAAGAVVIDTDLDTAGAAADAKATGDAITGLNGRLTELEGGTGGLTADVKVALLQILSKVAYIDEHGQDYLDALENALNPSVSLSSITCVYTQGGTVYDTDELSDLRTDLVVTAHYSDNTSETVNAYTLSGTLEVGTSAITVNYSGKTTTFDVVVTADPDKLPDGYTKLDYVWAKQVTNRPVYVNTGYTPSASTEIEYKFSNDTVVPNSETTGQFTGHLCSCNGYYTPFLRKQKNNNQTIFANRAGHESDMAIQEIAADTPFIIKAYTSDIGSDAVSKDGTTISTSMTAGSTTPSGTFSLFTYNGSTSSNYLLAGKLYYFKISENGVLVRNYIPCKNSSDVVGLYDTVNDTFNPSSTNYPLSAPE